MTEPEVPADVHNGSPRIDDWPSIRSWRKTQRTRLLARRQALGCQARRQASSRIVTRLLDEGPALHGARIGFYWPIKGEVDLRPLVRDLLQTDTQAALPVIVARDHPLEFWRWDPQQKLCSRGLWNIPAPTERNLVVPTVILVPLVGFDMACHRLGNGGGYYDRTLATLNPRPVTIGVGYEFARLRSIYPQPHDVPMDHVVTEADFFSTKRLAETDLAR